MWNLLIPMRCISRYKTYLMRTTGKNEKRSNNSCARSEKNCVNSRTLLTILKLKHFTGFYSLGGCYSNPYHFLLFIFLNGEYCHIPTAQPTNQRTSSRLDAHSLRNMTRLVGFSSPPGVAGLQWTPRVLPDAPIILLSLPDPRRQEGGILNTSQSR